MSISGSVAIASLALLLAAAACSSSNGAAPGTGGAGGAAGANGASGGRGGAAGTGGTAAGVAGAASAGAPGGTGGAAGSGGSAGSVGGAAGAGGTAGSVAGAAGAGGTAGSVGGAAGVGGTAGGSGGAGGACAIGYQMSASGCVWGTVPADPGFQNVPAGAWTLGAGATLKPTAAGHVDPGEVAISPAAFCTGGGLVRQSISMPTVAQSEPFAIKMVTNADCISRLGPGCRALNPVVAINGGVILFRDGPLNHAACLGERAYGGTFDLVIRPFGRRSCAEADAVVDHIDIAPSSICPPPGTIPDGDFDGTPATWKTWTLASDGFTALAEIAPTLGSGGSAAAHVVIRGACGLAAVHELISPPLSLPNLALQVRFKGTAGDAALALIDGATMAVLSGTGAQATANICLLESNKGMSQDLTFGLGLTSLPQALSCVAVNRDFVFDDSKFVSDASCAATAYLADGGFERTDPAAAWDAALMSGGVLVATTGDTVGIDTTAANVHGGARALKMVNSDGCGVRKAAFAASVPPSASGAGPALAFFYKAPALSKSKLAVTAAGASSGDLAAAADYTRAQICLDPTMAGQAVTVELSLTGNATGVCAAQPAETAWFDDFAVTTSAACPVD